MPGPYYTVYLESVRFKIGTNDHTLEAKVVYNGPRPRILKKLTVKYRSSNDIDFTTWISAEPATFGAPPKTLQNPVPAAYDVGVVGLYRNDEQKVEDNVTCPKPEITVVRFVKGDAYKQNPGEYRVLVRALASNVATGSYKMKLLVWNEQNGVWDDEGDSEVVAPNEALTYTWAVLVDSAHIILVDGIKKIRVKVQLISSPGGTLFSETEPVELPPFKNPATQPPPNRQGTNNMSNASISVVASLAEFHYAFKEREYFYVPVGGGWMPGGDIWLQIMYWDDNIADWQLLYEELNPPMSSYAAIRGFDHFLNFADYTIKAKLIGLTTVEDTKVITPNYDPDTGNGTVEVLDPETPGG